MPRKMVWTDGQDTQIRRLRTEGATWDVIAEVLGLARCTVIDRARLLGADHPRVRAAVPVNDMDRAPLPPGHAATWEAIIRGTSLAGVRFRSPGPVR